MRGYPGSRCTDSLPPATAEGGLDSCRWVSLPAVSLLLRHLSFISHKQMKGSENCADLSCFPQSQSEEVFQTRVVPPVLRQSQQEQGLQARDPLAHLPRRPDEAFQTHDTSSLSDRGRSRSRFQFMPISRPFLPLQSRETICTPTPPSEFVQSRSMKALRTQADQPTALSSQGNNPTSI